MKIYMYIYTIGMLISLFVHGSTPSRNSVSPSQKRPCMSILMVVGKFPWYTKQVILNQLVGLLERGHDVYVYANRKMQGYQYDPALSKYNIPNRIYYNELPTNLHRYGIIIFQYGSLAKKLCYIKKKYKLKAKLVTFFRGADIMNYREAAGNAYKQLFNIGDLFLPICNYFEFRLRVLGCDPKKIIVHRSCIECDKFPYKNRNRADKKIRIISVG